MIFLEEIGVFFSVIFFFRINSFGDRGMFQLDWEVFNIVLICENFEGVLVGSKLDFLWDKMVCYEGFSYIDIIEMFMGLWYIEGECSKGIIMGNVSFILIKGDVGIVIFVDCDFWIGEKKKKFKVFEEYVCIDCGKFICLGM